MAKEHKIVLLCLCILLALMIFTEIAEAEHMARGWKQIAEDMDREREADATPELWPEAAKLWRKVAPCRYEVHFKQKMYLFGEDISSLTVVEATRVTESQYAGFMAIHTCYGSRAVLHVRKDLINMIRVKDIDVPRIHKGE